MNSNGSIAGRDVSVLIVDDYREMVRLLRRILVEMGISNVEGASDGLSALAKLREKDIGLILLDCKMSPMSGIDLLRTIRSDDGLSSIPVIMITALDDERTVRAAVELKVDGYILKPFNKKAIADRLGKLMQI